MKETLKTLALLLVALYVYDLVKGYLPKPNITK